MAVNRALNPTLSASGSQAEMQSVGSWTQEFQSPTGLLLRTAITQLKTSTAVVWYCDPRAASPTGAYASAQEVYPGEKLTIALDLAYSKGSYAHISVRYHDGTSWVGALSTSARSPLIATSYYRISFTTTVPAGAQYVAVAVHQPSVTSSSWLPSDNSYIKYNNVTVDGIAASPVGYASDTLEEPPPEAISSLIGSTGATLLDPPVVLPSMIGAVSGTLAAGGSWEPTTVTLSGETLAVIARDPGQTLTCGTQQVISARPYQVLRIVDATGECTFSPGWWYKLTIVDGLYYGPPFGGDDDLAEWEGDADSSESVLYEEHTTGVMTEPVKCEVQELVYTLSPGAMVHGRYAQCQS